MEIEPDTSWKVYVDSKNSINNSNGSANFVFSITPPPNVKFNRVVLLDALIKKSYYLFTAPSNSFTLIENGVSTTITLGLGNANFNSFQAIVGAQLTAGSPNHWTYTVTYPNTTVALDTGKWIFNVSGNSSQPSLVFANDNKNFVYEAFGFAAGSTNTFVGNTLTSVNVADLNIEDSLYIKSDIVQSQVGGGILQAIKVAPSPNFSSIIYHCPAPAFYSQPVITALTTSISISIVDEHDRIIDLNGQNTTMTLLFYRENTVWGKLKAFMKFIIVKLGISEPAVEL